MRKGRRGIRLGAEYLYATGYRLFPMPRWKNRKAGERALRYGLVRPFRAWPVVWSLKPRPLAWAELGRPYGA